MKSGGRRGKTPRLPKNARIAIVGSGLAGLSAAIALEQAGFVDIVIYERDFSFSARKDGYGLTLTYNPKSILKDLGILDEVANADCPSRSHYLFDSMGNILGYYGNAFVHNRGWGQRGNLRVPRQTVRSIMMNKLKRTKIDWGHKLVEINNAAAGESKDENATIQLTFDTATSRVVKTTDLVIAADGIRSTTIKQWLPSAPRPKSLGIRLILGLTAGFRHDLVHEKGFYTLTEGHRLFVMPFSGCSVANPNDSIRYMWQLSFLSSDESTFSPEELQQQALFKCKNWHEPVASLIKLTPVSSIWGTMLYDTNPAALSQHLLQQSCQRVVLTGDALHAMSPFKGQGANQSLQDGPVLAKWLTKAGVDAAIKSCMREIVQRTSPTVQASREAALFWHSPESLSTHHKFAGCAENHVPRLLRRLQEQKITASTQNLDLCVMEIIDELQIGDSVVVEGNEDKNGHNTACIVSEDILLQNAAAGNLSLLRELSFNHSSSDICGVIQSARDPVTGKTCLHMAAEQGQVDTVHWLVTEAGCNFASNDFSGQTAMELAPSQCVRDMLSRWARDNSK